MKALTIWQPWATLIISGWKPHEFRGWKPPASLVGQRIAIHAAKRPMKATELRDIIDYVCSPQGVRDGIDPRCMDLLERTFWRKEDLPMSAVLGTAILGEPVTPLPHGLPGLGDSDQRVIYGWPMLEVEKFADPIPAKGAQGLWDWRA